MKLLVFIASSVLIFRYNAFYIKYTTNEGLLFRPSLRHVASSYHGWSFIRSITLNSHYSPGKREVDAFRDTHNLESFGKSKKERPLAVKALKDSQTSDSFTDCDSIPSDSSDDSQEQLYNDGITNKHKELQLKKLRDELIALDSDTSLREFYIKGHGPGGQKINKSTICVQLVYSSGSTDKKIVVRCKKHRQLLLNRIEATTILLNKLKDLKRRQMIEVLEEQGKEDRRILKLSEADKGRKRIIKEIRSIKKIQRRKVMPSDFD
ncbi:hypothetical protein BEWA_032830 [Theileria equi strain WA]|uniref:Prokaryotic-type class I peptide chain release factors domain-containing protein n=1 Tax=Theileria equi strain WA TaxID=1537102 RepID=L0AY05_THEEQ|nr:hypothetical protein BEWA_032830 [Theileria equi strain WA]AFZ80430.1 hypothetical protein BEWA_032830 [Theileria equi strain WA]|eukprot:XP_004830096.1 hypothetical protein BEWA_032830 [Theileria equi strain WA]